MTWFLIMLRGKSGVSTQVAAAIGNGTMDFSNSDDSGLLALLEDI